MSELFANVNGKLVPCDPCARKHGGNEQSSEAFRVISDKLSNRQNEILILIERAGRLSIGDGLTVDDLAELLDTTPNAISGRITELRIKGKIEKRGTRKTRSGCSAAVWVAK